MFPDTVSANVRLREIYWLKAPAHEFSVAANILHHEPHKLSVEVAGETVCATADDDPETHCCFTYSEKLCGAFSLYSNGDVGEPGAFIRLRLSVNGETLLDLSMEELNSVEELERYFDCYLCELESDTPAIPVPISRYWQLTDRRHLHCIRREQNVQSFPNDRSVVLLTLRDRTVADCTAELWFEQCWRRYGCLFGAPRGMFAYSYDPCTQRRWPRAGAAVAIGGEGSVCAFGNLQQSSTFRIMQYTDTLPSFCRTQHPSVSLPVHTLLLHQSCKPTQYFFETVTYTAREGGILYIPPSTPCKIQGNDNLVLRVEFLCDAPKDVMPFYLQPQSQQLIEHFRSLHGHWCMNTSDSYLRTMSNFYRVLAYIHAETSPSFPHHSPLMQEILQMIQRRFADPQLTVSAVAAAVGLSESRLYQIFRESLHLSPKQYILGLRIEYAKQLLSTQYSKVYEVALSSGFSNTKHFISAFSKATGMSPKKYATAQGVDPHAR